MNYTARMLAVLLCCLPMIAQAADMPAIEPLPSNAAPAAAPTPPPQTAAMPQAMPGDVPEPDEGDEPMVETKTSMPPPAAPEKPVAAPADKAANPNPAETGSTHYAGVLLRGLNKVTARAQTIEADIGSVERFGTIEIVAHSCWKAAPEDEPENAALLEISELKQGEAPRRIFLGWMYSSSPGLSSLEHPFYDITVVKCIKEAKG